MSHAFVLNSVFLTGVATIPVSLFFPVVWLYSVFACDRWIICLLFFSDVSRTHSLSSAVPPLVEHLILLEQRMMILVLNMSR